MALSIPPQLKTGEIWRFVQRAAQLEKVKPIIAYWCNFDVVNLILNKGLHTESDDCMTYTTNLMDKLERFKTENEGNDAVHDDVAAQAYVEQFAMETFQRADKVLRAKKATKVTAETFYAAATFLDLLAIWQNPLNEEIAAKSKYSKYHAMRILKAIKAGEDPNLTTEVDEDPELSAPPLDPNDPEVKKIKSLQPTVEDYHEDKPSPMQEDTPPQFLDDAPQTRSFSAQPSASSFPPSNEAGGDVSPLEPEPSNEEYFSQIPTFTADTTSNLTTATTGDPMQTSPALHPSSQIDPQNFYQPHASPIDQAPYVPPNVPQQPHAVQQSLSIPQASILPPVAVSQFTQRAPENLIADDEAMLQAQKHAKWAISALNFEDVPTAVKELRHALEALGAR